MRPRALPLLLILVALSGCLEEEGAPATPGVGAGAGADVAISVPPVDELVVPPTLVPVDVTPAEPTRPTTSPPPTTPTSPSPPTPEPAEENAREVLHRNKRPTDGDRDIFEVPRDAMLVELTVEANESFVGTVRLRLPDGRVAGSCAAPGCLVRVTAEPGIWNVDWDASVPDETTATVTAILWASNAPRVPTHHVYLSRPTWAGPLNRTDLVTVLPGHTELRGAFMVDVAQDGSSYLAQIILSGPDHAVYVTCTTGECPVRIGEPSAGLWRVSFQGAGNGTGYANLTLLGETYRPSSALVYAGDHHYASHPFRGDFGEGFTVPPGMQRLGLFVVFHEVAGEQDPSATAFVELRGPGIPEGTGCGWRTHGQHCEITVPIEGAGQYEVVYRGTDPHSSAQVHVKAA